MNSNFAQGQYGNHLRGKTVLITGAAQGIGRATALAFAKEGCRISGISTHETNWLT